VNKTGDQTPENVKTEVFRMTKGILNVVPEDPEVDHISHQMHDIGVHEHASDKSPEILSLHDVTWDGSKVPNPILKYPHSDGVLQEEEKEDDNVDH